MIRAEKGIGSVDSAAAHVEEQAVRNAHIIIRTATFLRRFPCPDKNGLFFDAILLKKLQRRAKQAILSTPFAKTNTHIRRLPGLSRT